MLEPGRDLLRCKPIRYGVVSFSVAVLLLVAGMFWLSRRPEIPAGTTPMPEGSGTGSITTVPIAECTLSELERVEGRLVFRESGIPFTGLVLEHYEDGQVKSQTHLADGKPHGKSVAYFPDGQVQIRESYHKGISHGKRIERYESGTKKSERMIIDGVNHGRYRQWYVDGTLQSEVQLFEGEPNGISRAWFPSGYLKAEVEMDNGTLVSRKSWEDGERFESEAMRRTRG